MNFFFIRFRERCQILKRFGGFTSCVCLKKNLLGVCNSCSPIDYIQNSNEEKKEEKKITKWIVCLLATPRKIQVNFVQRYTSAKYMMLNERTRPFVSSSVQPHHPFIKYQCLLNSISVYSQRFQFIFRAPHAKRRRKIGEKSWVCPFKTNTLFFVKQSK